MPHIENGPLMLDCVTLTLEWELFSVPIACSEVELIGDKDWYWCTSRDGPFLKVGAGISRVIVNSRYIASSVPICWVKGEEVGTLCRILTRA